MYRTWLIPYLEGALDAERRRQLETRLAEDPDLAAELTALRRAEPRLRQAITQSTADGERRPRPAPLWPRLRDRLDVRPARPERGPVFWWLGGVCAASAVVLAALALGPRGPRGKAGPDRQPTEGGPPGRGPPRQRDRNPRGPETTETGGPCGGGKARSSTASVWPPGLRRRPCGRSPAPARSAPAPTGACAGKLPMPVAPPFQMAQRDSRPPGGADNVGMAPPPTHSPLPSRRATNDLDADAMCRHMPGARRPSAAPFLRRRHIRPACRQSGPLYALEASNQPSPAASRRPC